MNSLETGISAEAFRSALEHHDFAAADRLLRIYTAAIGPEEIENTQRLIVWALGETRLHKARSSEALMLATRFLEAYAPQSDRHTWTIVA